MDPGLTEPTGGLAAVDVAHAWWRYMAASLGDSAPDSDDYAGWDSIHSDLGSDTRTAVCAVLKIVSAAPSDDALRAHGATLLSDVASRPDVLANLRDYALHQPLVRAQLVACGIPDE